MTSKISLTPSPRSLWAGGERTGAGVQVRELGHLARQPGSVALEHEQVDLLEHRVDGVRVERLARRALDLLDRRRLRALVRGEQLLVQLLPRPAARRPH